MDWHARTLPRVDLTALPVTVNWPSFVIHASQGRAFVCSNSSSKVTAPNSPNLRSTRSALRSQRLAVGMSSMLASNSMRPSDTLICSNPSAFTSFLTTRSRPKAVVAMSVILSVEGGWASDVIWSDR